MFIVIISSIIVVVSLFVGFFPHTEHCDMLSAVGIHSCPGWEFHIVLGGLLYILAVFISQKGDIHIITSYVTSYTSNTPKELLPQ